jgi:oligoribonuclease
VHIFGVMVSEKNLVWLDLEMTGLYPEKDTILEIATIVTDSALSELAEGPCLAIHQSDEVLGAMDPWCVEHHGQSGLTERVRRSPVSIAEAQVRTLEFLVQWCPPGKAPLCGNTIGQDRRFLVRYMPLLHDFFHYRSIDVSTIKELVQRWYPQIIPYVKAKEHEALADVRESIAELTYYRRMAFK